MLRVTDTPRRPRQQGVLNVLNVPKVSQRLIVSQVCPNQHTRHISGLVQEALHIPPPSQLLHTIILHTHSLFNHRETRPLDKVVFLFFVSFLSFWYDASYLKQQCQVLEAEEGNMEATMVTVFFESTRSQCGHWFLNINGTVHWFINCFTIYAPPS